MSNVQQTKQTTEGGEGALLRIFLFMETDQTSNTTKELQNASDDNNAGTRRSRWRRFCESKTTSKNVEVCDIDRPALSYDANNVSIALQRHLQQRLLGRVSECRKILRS